MQSNRMFEIVYLLLNRKSITARELAEHFEVSSRTIYRDVENLSAAGIPVYMSKGKGGGISLMDSFVLNKTVLTQEEKTDILSAVRAVGAVNCNATETALTKLSSLFGERNADWIAIDFSAWSGQKLEADIFQKLKGAVLNRQLIRFSYSGSSGTKTEREAEPLKLCFKGMSRYLYAFCHLRNDYRFFKLSRIKELQVLDRHYSRNISHDIFAETNHDFPMLHLKLRFSADLAYRVYDEFDHYTLEDDGHFLVQAEYPDGSWLLPGLLSFGAGCEVLEPESIRIQVQNELKKMMACYLPPDITA